MKKFTSLLIGCSLALAGVAMAQQPDQQSSPTKKKKQGAQQTNAAQTNPAEAQPGATNELGAGKGRKNRASQESATGAQTGTDVSGQPAGKTHRLMWRAGRRPSRIRSRCNRSRRSTRIFVRSQSRNRFRRSRTIRTIGFKEAISGRVRNTTYSARIIRNGMIKAGIGRV